MLLLDQRERETLADRQGLLASGVREDLPTLADEKQRLYAALVAEPKRLESVDNEQMELRQAMGVA